MIEINNLYGNLNNDLNNFKVYHEITSTDSNGIIRLSGFEATIAITTDTPNAYLTFYSDGYNLVIKVYIAETGQPYIGSFHIILFAYRYN